MKLLAGIVIGAIVGALVVYALFGRPGREATTTLQFTPEELRAAADAMKAAGPRYATITLRRGESARCLAEIDNPRVGAFPNEPVKWIITDHEENPCRPDGPWAVWLVFEGSSLPFQQREVRIGRSQRAIPVNGNAAVADYTYKVWMRDHNKATYELIDPVLQVEDPPRVARF
jgi:hypothetical protein